MSGSADPHNKVWNSYVQPNKVFGTPLFQGEITRKASLLTTVPIRGFYILEMIFHEISFPFTGEDREHLDIFAPRATIYPGGLDSDSNFAEHMVAV